MEDEAVEGNAVAGEDADEVVGFDGGEGEEGFGKVAVVEGGVVWWDREEAGVGGFELGEAAEGAGGAGAGTDFEPTTGE